MHRRRKQLDKQNITKLYPMSCLSVNHQRTEFSTHLVRQETDGAGFLLSQAITHAAMQCVYHLVLLHCVGVNVSHSRTDRGIFRANLALINQSLRSGIKTFNANASFSVLALDTAKCSAFLLLTLSYWSRSWANLAAIIRLTAASFLCS